MLDAHEQTVSYARVPLQTIGLFGTALSALVIILIANVDGVSFRAHTCLWSVHLTPCYLQLIGFAVDALKLMGLLVVSGLCEALYTVSRSSYIKTTVRGTVSCCYNESFILTRFRGAMYVLPIVFMQQRGRVLSIIGGLNRLTRAIGPAIGGWISVLGCVSL